MNGTAEYIYICIFNMCMYTVLNRLVIVLSKTQAFVLLFAGTIHQGICPYGGS